MRLSVSNATRTWKEDCRFKWIPPKELESKIQELRKAGKSIATLNGSFDLLHAGHLHIIYEASQLADVLIVALNSDSSIHRYKAKHLPIVPLVYRLEMLSAIGFVSFVTWFDELDPRKLLDEIKPDVHVNGVEYGEDCIEAEVVRRNGGCLHLSQRLPGLATSDIITKIKNIQ